MANLAKSIAQNRASTPLSRSWLSCSEENNGFNLGSWNGSSSIMFAITPRKSWRISHSVISSLGATSAIDKSVVKVKAGRRWMPCRVSVSSVSMSFFAGRWYVVPIYSSRALFSFKTSCLFIPFSRPSFLTCHSVPFFITFSLSSNEDGFMARATDRLLCCEDSMPQGQL